MNRGYDGWTDLLAAIFRSTADLAGAACMGAPPKLFDPPDQAEPLVDSEYRQRAALNYCTDCPVIAQCREWAGTQPVDKAIRAGTRSSRPTQTKNAS